MIRIWVRYLTVLLTVPMLAGAALAVPSRDLSCPGRLLDLAGEPHPGPMNLQNRIFDLPNDGTRLHAAWLPWLRVDVVSDAARR